MKCEYYMLHVLLKAVLVHNKHIQESQNIKHMSAHDACLCLSMVCMCVDYVSVCPPIVCMCILSVLCLSCVCVEKETCNVTCNV